MTDAESVEETRCKQHDFKPVSGCWCSQCGTLRFDRFSDEEKPFAYCRPAQYDALQAERDEEQGKANAWRTRYYTLLEKKLAATAENGKLREALHLLVVCIVELNPSHVQASMLGNAIDTACKALGKPLGYWREGGQDDDETVS